MKLIFNILCLFITVQFTLFGIFLVNHPKGSRTSNKILASFLFANALYLVYIPFFNNGTGFFFEYQIYFFRTTEPFSFLFGPLLYFYTVSLTIQDFKFKKKYLWHSLPFILDYLYILIFFYLKSYEVKLEILYTDRWFVIKLLCFNFFFFAQFIIYLIACLIIIRKHRKHIINYFSSLEKVKLSWLKLIIIAYIVIWSIDLLNSCINVGTFSIDYYVGMSIFSTLVSFILANLMIFRGLQYPNLFTQIQSNTNNKKYKKSPLTSELKKRYLNRLVEYIEKEKPYLDFNLTLSELSSKSKIPVHYLSQVINEVLDKNFYTFINEYRIKEAIKMFTHPNYKEKSILDILYEVGFNSRSTFYSLFQKITGETPSAFRKKVNSFDSK